MKKILLTAAGLAIVIGISFGAYQLLQNNFSLSSFDDDNENTVTQNKEEEVGTMGSGSEEFLKENALDVTFYDAEGNTVMLSSFQNKVTVLNFWASWCSPCESEMPYFQRFYEELGDEVNFVMLNLTDGERETISSADDFISNGGFTFPVYYDSDLDAANTYYTTSIPVTYIIDTDGMIAAQHIGAISEEDLESMIQNALSENTK